MRLPESVHKVRSRGRTYYYWHPGRGTERAVKPIPLPNAEKHSAAFWRQVDKLQEAKGVSSPGSVGGVVLRYRGNAEAEIEPSPEYARLAEKTRRTYDVHLNRFVEVWGHFPARDVTPAAVLGARNGMVETPVMANQMLAVGRTLFDWAVPLGVVDINPFDKIKPLDVLDRGHVPWPDWVVEMVLDTAPEDLCRLVRLGRMTCQRESDLVRLGPKQRDNARAGVWCRPKKTRKSYKAFLIPLATADALELDRWAKTPIKFENSRWKAPIERFRDDLYLYSPKGVPYSPDSLRARWGRWLETENGQALSKRWVSWLTDCVRRYDWDIEPEDSRGPTVHGLRGSGILLRYAIGYGVNQIANDIGMSRPMVEHYMRFKDQMEVAVEGRARLKVVDAGGRPGTDGSV